ncbi:MAG: methyltransferase [Planctomycetota bacterium]|jgi:SAM-dependent methyltransferase
MTQKWPNGQQILAMSEGFTSACVIGAAAELDVFTLLGHKPTSAERFARRLEADRRATAILLDALAALGLLEKRNEVFSVPPEVQPFLTEESPQAVLPMIRHRMNILRMWSQLAWVTKAGIPGPRQVSIRGAEADRASFIAAMHTVSAPVADDLVARLGPPGFRHLLDVGAGPGTWTKAFLEAVPNAQATLFDLPDAIGQARKRFAGTELADRIRYVPGDFYADKLPAGADFVWLSAIAHQHSRRHNRELYGKILTALAPGGTIAVRDVVMEPSRTRPVAGALFAVNMLVNTDTGGTFTFDEYAEDLEAAGFASPTLAVKSEAMTSVVTAKKP